MKGQFAIPDVFWISSALVVLFPLWHWISAKIDLTGRSGTMQTKEYVFWQTALTLTLIFFYPQQTGSFMYFQF
jgi:hypothetical protein